MYIEEEILAYLDETIKPGSANRERDKKLIAYFYGFGDSAWPTLDRAGDQFGIATRERVRQVINHKFRDNASLSDLPGLHRAADIIAGSGCSTAEEVTNKLDGARLCGPELNLKGLLNLLHDFGLCEDIDLYSVDLDRATRQQLEDELPCFLIRSDYLDALKKGLKRAHTYPGMLGLARLSALAEQIGNRTVFNDVLKLISISDDFCVIDDTDSEGQDRWYCWEESDNVLLNHCGKIFSVINRCGVQALATVLCNALHARSAKGEYPGRAAVERFIRTSRSFEVDDDVVRFRGKPITLTDIQQAVVAFFGNVDSTDYNTLRDHLEREGFQSAAIVKAVMNSPLVLKSGERKNYVYQLVPPADSPALSSAGSAQRYASFVRRLKRLLDSGTDVSIQSTRRREQGILQEWLFGGKEVEHCALCGQRYSVNALVAAHKKRRADCTEGERTDPNIVMPLCIFGCDFLYEHHYLVIRDGQLCPGTLPQSDTSDRLAALRLSGRYVDVNWLERSAAYFAHHALSAGVSS